MHIQRRKTSDRAFGFTQNKVIISILTLAGHQHDSIPLVKKNKNSLSAIEGFYSGSPIKGFLGKNWQVKVQVNSERPNSKGGKGNLIYVYIGRVASISVQETLSNHCVV